MAEKHAINVLEHDPENPEAKRIAALVFHNLGTEQSAKGAHDRAFDYYERALAAAPEQGGHSFTLLQVEAQSCNRQKDFTDICSKYINQYPHLYRDKHFNLGMVLLGMADGLDSKPDSEAEHKKQELLQRSKASLLAYLSTYPDKAESHYAVGELYAALGDFTAAEGELRFLEGKDAKKARDLSAYIQSKKCPPPPRIESTARIESVAAVAPTVSKPGSDKKIAAGICAIVLGALGVHKFILGYVKPGLILLAITVLTCGYGAIATAIVGIIEGIIYLTKSDDDFVRTYIENKKQGTSKNPYLCGLITSIG